LGKALYKMTTTLRENAIEIERQDWLKTGYNKLADAMKGHNSIDVLSEKLINFYCSYLNAHIGLFYIVEEDFLKLNASWGIAENNKQIKKNFY